MISALVMAAGASLRLGRPKQLLPWGAGTLLSASTSAFLEAGLDAVVVVLGHEAARIAREAGLPQDERLRCVVNDRWAEGMAGSLRCGLDAAVGADAVLVGLADQPELPVSLIRAVCAAWSPGVPLVVPVHPHGTGHPVLFARSLFAELRALCGDVGGREIVLRHRALAATVAANPVPDIDTEDDYRAALARHLAR